MALAQKVKNPDPHLSFSCCVDQQWRKSMCFVLSFFLSFPLPWVHSFFILFLFFLTDINLDFGGKDFVGLYWVFLSRITFLKREGGKNLLERKISSFCGLFRWWWWWQWMAQHLHRLKRIDHELRGRKKKKKEKRQRKKRKTLTHHLDYHGELWLDLGVTVSSQLQRKYKGLRRIDQPPLTWRDCSPCQSRNTRQATCCATLSWTFQLGLWSRRELGLLLLYKHSLLLSLGGRENSSSSRASWGRLSLWLGAPCCWGAEEFSNSSWVLAFFILYNHGKRKQRKRLWEVKGDFGVMGA